EAFVRTVLEPFLPPSYAIGSGRIVDAYGRYSDHFDIVIYNRDVPRIGLSASQPVYLYESVLAAIVVKSKLIRKSFFDALDCCTSLGKLNTRHDKKALHKLAIKNGLKSNDRNEYEHEDPLQTARFKMIGRPPAFVYGFSGIKNSHRQLEENIQLWLQNQQDQTHTVEMKSLPAVIATQGCFAWRNGAPLMLSSREMLGLGTDHAPVRLIILQLLYLINRRLTVKADGYGFKPELGTYLNQFSPPKFESGVVSIGATSEVRSEPVQADSSATTAAPKQASSIGKKPVEPAIKINTDDQSAEEAPAQEKVGKNAPTATLGEASFNSKQDAPAEAYKLDFIESELTAETEDAVSGEAEGSSPEKIKDVKNEDTMPAKDSDSEFEKTVIVMPGQADGAGVQVADDSPVDNKVPSSQRSTDAFIARVKEQMSGNEPFPQFQSETEPEPDPFTSTIPQ
ncbi:MAG: hypothetical protein ACI822_003171, partial [Gammaproteobacteria bacterium]